ncbi:MAG: lysophospholipid acyltransferase family protein [Bacteroidales bacterium]|nr:1-acyl-sn-glycerol-3-phosphate acyltransferase [Bacteroidales bacterium]MDD4602962.1 lysophospholipid acyltransferase family protein [Bacteroidales bacterium]
MQAEIFSSNEYHTHPDTHRFLADRILVKSRWVFMWNYIRIVFKSRSSAIKGKYDSQAWIESSHNIFDNIEGCGGRFHITGLDNIRNSIGPVIFLSNHMSTLETMIFPGIIQPIKEVTFVVKEELVKHWAFGAIMRSRNPIVLSRSNPREDFKIVMDQGSKLLTQGISLVVFPQSTRRMKFNPKEFHSLGTKLAIKAGVQVIPVAIKTDFWGNGKIASYLGPIDRKKPIYIAFGSPMQVTGNGKEEHQKIIDFIQTHLEVWEADTL